MTIRHVTFAQLPVTDQARATRFYVDTLGLAVARDDPYGADRWIELAVGTSPTRILLFKVDTVPGGERPALTLSVADVRATARGLEDKGVAFIQPPEEAPWNPGESFAVFLDTEGNPVLLNEAGPR